uniref:Cytochrome f n=1 Tax=Compsopogon caeruleus TaxID=31354 RepID=A0A1Z1XAZ2_9RHOD|nr:cytochrome f [Compsopogon caeruleus]ARX96032.1 cytochrome f [Compsopogon caeruleus]
MYFNKIFNSLKNNASVLFLFLIIITTVPQIAVGFPIFAQQAYENPREATGKIVCANCHLAQKPVSIELPKSVLPNSVFEATVTIPLDTKSQQVLANGSKGVMNIGAIVILPEGFKLAPKDMLNEELKQKVKNVYIQPYSTQYSNILVVGPMPSNAANEIIFPILAPDPAKDKSVYFIKYPIYVGGNRGRGQLYPTGEKSNNNIYNAVNTGEIVNIQKLEKGNYEISIKNTNGDELIEKIPAGLELIVKEGQKIIADQPLTKDPNIGGFGQTETEIVLQNPTRIKLMIAFFFSIVLGQTFFVLKKKQFERVQAAQMNF